jgi:hypothetical protein
VCERPPRVSIGRDERPHEVGEGVLPHSTTRSRLGRSTPDPGRALRAASAPAAPTGGLRPRDPDCWAIEGDRVLSCDALPSPRPKAPILVPDSAEPDS